MGLEMSSVCLSVCRSCVHTFKNKYLQDQLANPNQMVLLAEVSAKWINFDYLNLTSFDFCKSLIAACAQDILNYCSPLIATVIFCF